jgi:hypothetical protein
MRSILTSSKEGGLRVSKYFEKVTFGATHSTSPVKTDNYRSVTDIILYLLLVNRRKIHLKIISDLESRRC